MQSHPLDRCFLVVLLHLKCFLGRISAISRVTFRWSHFLVQISELFSRLAVTFSHSDFGTFSRGLRSELFLEGCVYIFSAILGVQTPTLDPPKNIILAKCSDTEVHRKCFRGSVSRGSLSGNCHVLQLKIVVCKFRRYDHHTHVLVTTRKGSWHSK